MAASETILLTVDVAFNNSRLAEIGKELRANAEQVKQLNQEFKAGAISADFLAAAEVRLKQQAANLRTEQNALTKANRDQLAINNAASGSIEQLRAQLAANTKAYNALSAAERDNSEAGQQLQANTKAISDQLKVLEGAVGDTRRNVGNYAGSIGPLIQELVKLQEQQKQVGEGSAEFQKVQAQIGFVQKATREAGAKMGLSYEQTQNKLQEYGEAIRPVIAEVVKLEKEQEKLDDSSEAYARIGFQIQGLKKKVEEVPVQTKKLSTSLKEAAASSDTLSGATARFNNVKEKFTQATNLAKLAIGGEVTALGALRLALIATGLGALVVLLGSVVVFLTKTAEGTKLVESVMQQLGAVVNVVIDRLGTVGKAVLQVLEGDFVGAGKTAKGVLTGIGDEITREVKLAKDLAAETNAIEKAERALGVERAKSKATVESLKFIAEDTTKATKERIAATQQAFGIEIEQERKAIELQQRRIDLLKQEQAARKGNVDKESLDKLAEAETKLAETVEAAKTRQIELRNKINEIQGQALATQKEAADKASAEQKERATKEFEARRNALKAENDLLDQRLRKVKTNSIEEENLLRQKLTNSYQLELMQKGLSVKQRQAIEEKYLNDQEQLAADFAKRRTNEALQADVEIISARLAIVQKGSEQELQAQRELIETQRRQALVAISETSSDEARAAKERAANADAQAKQDELTYQTRLKNAAKFYQDELNDLRTALAKGLVSQEQYQIALFQQELGSAAARKQIAEDLGRDTAEIDQRITDLKIDNLQRVTDAQRAKAQEQAQITNDLAVLVGQFFVDATQDAGLALENFAARTILVLIESVEKAILAAQIKILVEAFSSADSVASFGAAGGFKAAATIALVTAATTPLKAALRESASPSKQFAEGGRIIGPGTSTSDSIAAYGPGDTAIPTYRLSNSEHVLTAEEVRNMGGHGAVEQLRAKYKQPGATPILDWLPQVYAQTRFAIGGPVLTSSVVPANFDGGFAQRAISEGGGVNTAQAKEIARQLALIIPTSIEVQAIKKGLSDYDRPRAKTKIGGRG